MIIDMKYHIASLVAVFLALSIGILLGIGMNGNEAVVERLKQMTDKMDVKIDQMEEKNDKLTAELRKLEANGAKQAQFAQEVTPVLIKNRLVGKNIAIINTGDYPPDKNLVKYLKVAGANISGIVNIGEGFTLSDQAQKFVVAERLGLSTESKTEDVANPLTKELVTAVSSGANPDFLKFLADQGLLTYEGTFTPAVNTVVVVGGGQGDELNQSRVSLVDKVLIQSFVNNNITVLGAENRDVQLSYMPMYQELKVSTVDNADTIQGVVAVVWALEGNQGNYGVKETAKRMLPVVEVEAVQ